MIALCETWLHQNSPYDYFNIPNYQPLVYKNRKSRGGGVAFFVHEGLDFRVIDKRPQLELLTIEINLSKNNKLQCTVVYNEPNADKQSFLNT